MSNAMVTGENKQIVPAEDVCAATEERVLCIIRDMVDNQSQGRKSLNLPASLTVGEMLCEVASIFDYVPGTISVHYEKPCIDGFEEQVLEKIGDKALGELCNGGGRRHNFTINEDDSHLPQKIKTKSNVSHPIQCQDRSEEGAAATSFSQSPEPKEHSCCSPTSPSEHSYTYSPQLIKSDTGYVGLVNQAMTCYLNSLLQTLYMTPEFRNALYRWEFDGLEEETHKSIPCQLQKLFLQLQTSKKRASETTDLTRSFGWDSSEVWQQHDVQELCRVMFDALEQKWKKTDQADLINQLYQGKLKDYVKCLECGYESARIDAYLDIPLVIRPFGSSQAYGSVEDALNAFVQPEILDGTNQYFCEKCNKKCNAHKGLKFVSFPYLLTLQLKRFDFDYTTMHRIKLNDRMTFPEILNLNHMIEESVMEMMPQGSEVTECKQMGKTLLNDDIISNCMNQTDSADEGIDEGIEIENSTATSTNSDASSLSSEAAANDRNAKELESKGPFVYELFSIMIHSGSAAGGHYYAYIKSFKDGQWYSFNDQHVTRITYDDIRKTYGGPSAGRGYYSAAYTSSTNAYMLMYRQIDKERNADFIQPEDFPEHVKMELQTLKDKEEAERKQREIDKSTCKIKLFCYHPTTQQKMEKRLEVHKDKTLRETTEIALKLCELENLVCSECCRLVKYDEYSDALERSFENEENTPIGKILGGVKSTYTFDLLLETKQPEQTFQEYKPGGVTVKVFLVDLEMGTILYPTTIRTCHNQTVSEFKNLIAQTLGVFATYMRCVLERYHSDLRLLLSPLETLKSEGFFRSNKVFVEYSDEKDAAVPFTESRFYKLLDRYQNTIRIFINIPTSDEVQEFCQASQLQSNKDVNCSNTFSPLEDSFFLEKDRPVAMNEGISDSELDTKLNTMSIHSCSSDPAMYSSCEHNGSTSPHLSEGRTSSPIGQSGGSQDMNTSVELSLNTNFNTSIDGRSVSPDDSTTQDRVGDSIDYSLSDTEQLPLEQNAKGMQLQKDQAEIWDLDTSERDVDDEEYRRYFNASESTDKYTGQRSLTVYVDKRITLGALKREIEKYIGTTSENFKVFRVYSNNQEFESTRLSENLSFLEDGKLNIKLGRALRPGEYRVKVYQLLVNDPEPCKFLIETIFAKGMSVLESKGQILQEVTGLLDQCELPVSLDRCRLRKKTWKNPGTVYLDNQLYDDDIAIFANWEVFLEIVNGLELMKSPSQLSLFVRRWRQSKYELEPLQEVVLSQQTVEQLLLKISEISSIPVENIEFAKGRGTFPCEISVLDIEMDLDWDPRVSSLNMWPLCICDDGSVIIFRDNREELMELSEEKKKELQQKENTRISRINQKMAYSPRKERALKIYTDDCPSSRTLAADLD